MAAFGCSLRPQLLQDVQVLVEMFGSPANPGMFDLSKPLLAMTGIVDGSSRTRNCPAAIDCFQPTHHPSQIPGSCQITASQFAQRTHASLPVVDRLEIVPA